MTVSGLGFGGVLSAGAEGVESAFDADFNPSLFVG